MSVLKSSIKEGLNNSKVFYYANLFLTLILLLSFLSSLLAFVSDNRFEYAFICLISGILFFIKAKTVYLLKKYNSLKL